MDTIYIYIYVQSYVYIAYVYILHGVCPTWISIDVFVEDLTLNCLQSDLTWLINGTRDSPRIIGLLYVISLHVQLQSVRFRS